MNVEYKVSGSLYPKFFESVKSKLVTIACDKNTKPFADDIENALIKNGADVKVCYFDDEDLIPTEEKCTELKCLANKTDYILAVGSGSLNDMCKYVSTTLDIPCGVLITAASMDGYVSKGSAIMVNGVKVTYPVHVPTDILVDLEIIRNAPSLMTAAGFGDIIGKYTCLSDWQLSNIVNGEEINKEAFELMEKALSNCVSLFNDLKEYKPEAVAKLTDALITAGVSMAICGNSRPASGSEHHQSHFLEMDFVKRGERVPLHGVKVAIGALISIELYNYVITCNIERKEQIAKIVAKLPPVERVKTMLKEMGCPVRFSEVGVRREVMEEMLEKAHTVRDRYTILTFINENGLMPGIKDYIMENYF
ncbi:MAG: sn-glycerol-1-phosphate dehydrogenase [Clostridia bacterium]|nr:sn-glycerol-1-phosphate dehydrogenase [Clostridia bacterium]